MANIQGTRNRDNLTGTGLADRINGLAGNDIINGLEGADIIDGVMATTAATARQYLGLMTGSAAAKVSTPSTVVRAGT